MKNLAMTPLADACEVFADGDWIESKDQSPSGVRLIQTGNVGEGVFKDRPEKARYISDATFKRLRCTEIVEGDCLISRLPDPVGRSCILPDTGERMITAVDCTIVRFDRHKLIPEFFNFYSQSFDYLKAVETATTGTTRNRISRSNLGRVRVPIPPLAEQKRIVGILDKAFDGIAAAIANTERNLHNARALFESHLQAVFTQRSGGWAQDNLKNLTTKIGSGATPKGGEEAYKSEGISLIRSLNVHDLGFRYPKLAFLDNAQADDLLNVEVQSRDVLLNITGASLARCCIVPEDVLPARVNQHVSIIRPIGDKIDAAFLHYLLISKLYKDHLLQTGAKGGSTRQAITKAQIQDFCVKYPKEVSEQKSIAAKLDLLLAETQRIETIYEQKLAALEAMKKSLLHQAFTGQLTQKSTRPALDPLAGKVANIKPTDLHAGILAMAYQLHEKSNRQRYFGHVKAEKIAHMIEAHSGIDLGRVPVKDAAGPDDYPHLMRVEHRARKAGFFSFARIEGSAYRVTKFRKFDALVEQTHQALGAQKGKVERLLKIMLPMNTQQAEIFATVYAAWNNLLLDEQNPTDDEIVSEARENWHPDKVKIERRRFFAAVQWLRDKGVVPEGRGKRVVNKGR
jgi:restriction endonuclease S subunit